MQAQGNTAEDEANDAPPGSRFSAVIEKIERLYMVWNMFIMLWIFLYGQWWGLIFWMVLSVSFCISVNCKNQILFDLVETMM